MVPRGFWPTGAGYGYVKAANDRYGENRLTGSEAEVRASRNQLFATPDSGRSPVSFTKVAVNISGCHCSKFGDFQISACGNFPLDHSPTIGDTYDMTTRTQASHKSTDSKG